MWKLSFKENIKLDFLAKIITLLWYTGYQQVANYTVIWLGIKMLFINQRSINKFIKINMCRKRVSEVCNGLRQGRERDYLLDILMLFTSGYS